MRNLLYNILTLFILSVIFVSCSGSNEYEAKIKRAENIMDSNPDSALAILNSIDDSRLSSKKKMHCHLMRTLAQNKADIPFKSDSVMKEVVKYYDSHGTSNEKLTANYLMGRVYADIDNPMVALEFYHKAVKQADTTSADCDFKTLSRVHGQMAVLFHIQLLPEYELKEEQLAIDYAWKAKDTLAALMFYEHMAGIYYWMNMKDSALAISKKSYKLYRDNGYLNNASGTWPTAICIYLEREQYSKAKPLMDDFEQNSGFFDKNRETTVGHETYYGFKGLFYEGINKLDSAEYFYRKLLSFPFRRHNHEIAYNGMMSVFKKKGCIDSVAKYARLYCITNDSSYRKSSTDKILRMQAIYDYNHSLHIADKKTIEAEKYKVWAYGTTISILIIIHIIYYILRRLRKKQLSEAKAYATIMFQYSKINKEFKQSQQSHEKYKKAKQEEIEKLQVALSAYQNNNERPEKWNIEERMLEEDVVLDLHALAIKGTTVSDGELESFINTIKHYIPTFISKIEDVKNRLTVREQRVCMFIKLRFSPAEIGVLLNLTTQQVTNTRRSINKKMFGENTATTLDNNISRL